MISRTKAPTDTVFEDSVDWQRTDPAYFDDLAEECDAVSERCEDNLSDSRVGRFRMTEVQYAKTSFKSDTHADLADRLRGRARALR